MTVIPTVLPGMPLRNCGNFHPPEQVAQTDSVLKLDQKRSKMEKQVGELHKKS